MVYHSVPALTAPEAPVAAISPPALISEVGAGTRISAFDSIATSPAHSARRLGVSTTYIAFGVRKAGRHRVSRACSRCARLLQVVQRQHHISFGCCAGVAAHVSIPDHSVAGGQIAAQVGRTVADSVGVLLARVVLQLGQAKEAQPGNAHDQEAARRPASRQVSQALNQQLCRQRFAFDGSNHLLGWQHQPGASPAHTVHQHMASKSRGYAQHRRAEGTLAMQVKGLLHAGQNKAGAPRLLPGWLGRTLSYVIGAVRDRQESDQRHNHKIKSLLLS